MNLILIEKHELCDDRLLLQDRRAEHIVKVLRANIGDRLRIGIVDGELGEAAVLRICRKYPFSVELTTKFGEPRPDPPPLDLILALPRPIMLRRILTQVAALGIGTLHLVNAARVEKSFWKSTLVEQRQFREFLLQGLEQAMDTILPRVVLHTRFKPFVEDFFPDVAAGYEQKLLAHPSAVRSVSSVIQAPFRRAVFAIGPEGGWVDYEVEKFMEQGFDCCSVGQRILKVDTAVIALHSRILGVQELRRETLAEHGG